MQQILSTLIYHSIFDYPLTIEEIYHFLISDHPIAQRGIQGATLRLVRSKHIVRCGKYYVFPPITAHNLRPKRQGISTKKLKIARRAADVIGRFPWIRLIAITGALAMHNTDENDDIDLMIVTSKNRLWLVRPLVILFISLFFKRRLPMSGNKEQETRNNENALCLNLWLDESSLKIPVSQRNLYAAHELAQMKPIVNKDQTYERMMTANQWGKKYLANRWERCKRLQVKRMKSQKAGRCKESSIFVFHPFNLFNLLAFHLQHWYMRSKMTNERVSLHAAFFHPGNRADTILSRYDCLRHRYF